MSDPGARNAEAIKCLSMIAAICLSDIINVLIVVIRSKVWKRITKILEVLEGAT
jgi:hypothetical protein